MAAHLIIERPNHGPRVLRTFGTREAAEAYREWLLAGQPTLAPMLWIVSQGRAAGEPVETLAPAP